MEKRTVSVVLPIYLPSDKHRSMTDKCLFLARSKTNFKFELVIVETCSDYYRNEADIYIHEYLRTDPNKSINAGLKAATGEYVVFLANDVFVDDGWLESLLECFDKYPDCGLASLGTKEFKQEKTDEIIKRVYFSVCMFRKKDAWLDPNYQDLYDDSDLVMRILTRGEMCYQNLNCIVEHVNHATYGAPNLNSEKNIKQKKYFEEKWKDHKHQPFYKLFA